MPVLCVIAHLPVLAGSFEVAVAPTRFEISGQPGQRLGQSLELYNVGNEVNTLSFRTLDWRFTEQGQLSLHDELMPDSCRSWVTLERRTRQVAARSNQSFRFQVDVPADAPVGECRFMIAVEGIEPAHQSIINSGSASLSLPVSGRIAVAVYLAVGGAKPKLEVVSLGTDSTRTQRHPVVTVYNSGNAHGRLDGSLDATDAHGKAFELVPDGGPILPGQTRSLLLTPKDASKGADKDTTKPLLQYPLKVRGTLDWDDGAFKLEATLP